MVLRSSAELTSLAAQIANMICGRRSYMHFQPPIHQTYMITALKGTILPILIADSIRNHDIR